MTVAAALFVICSLLGCLYLIVHEPKPTVPSEKMRRFRELAQDLAQGCLMTVALLLARLSQLDHDFGNFVPARQR
jgi:hypothetical protein